MRVRENIHEFGEDIALAKMDGLAKALLWFFAFQFEWTERNPAPLKEREVCALVGMTQANYYSKRDYLEQLGWIKYEQKGVNEPILVFPMVGNDDPDYGNFSWANWHPLNHPYLGLIRSEQIKMVKDGVDVPFSKVYQLFEDDDELYESFLESDPSDSDSEAEIRFKTFIQIERESANGG